MFKKLIILALVQLFSLSLIAQISQIEQISWEPNTIGFGNSQWKVKNGISGPHNNNWGGYNNVHVDSEGLHLKIKKQDTTWYCAEVKTEDMNEYGTYIFDMEFVSPYFVEQLDPNIIMSTFFYKDSAPYGPEFTIEFAKWGDANDDKNTEFTIFKDEDNSKHYPQFQTESDLDTIHHKIRTYISWTEDQILLKVFRSLDANGETWELMDIPNEEDEYSEWTYNSSCTHPGYSFDPEYVPSDDDNMHLHINFWLNEATAPTNGQNAEVVITDYRYIPLGKELNAHNNYQQRAIMVFSSDYFTHGSDGNWWGNTNEMLDFIEDDLNRNCVYISTGPLNIKKYGQDYYQEMSDFIAEAHYRGLEVIAMPIGDDHGDYYLPSNHYKAFDNLKDKYRDYQVAGSQYEKFDGVYFDIEPWTEDVYWNPAEDDDDYDLMNTYLGYYLDLITEIRTWHNEFVINDPNFFFAFATNKWWHKWSLPAHPANFPNGSISVFKNAGATCVVPQIYNSSDSPAWGYKYDYSWFDHSGSAYTYWEVFNEGDNLLVGLSAYNPIYLSNDIYLADESVINYFFMDKSRSFHGSVLYGYGAAKYTDWAFNKEDSFHDTDLENGSTIRGNKSLSLLTYPDPAQTELTIKDPPSCDYNVQIVSKYGEVLYSEQNKSTIDVRSLKADIYYLILNDGSTTYHSTFIKSN